MAIITTACSTQLLLFLNPTEPYHRFHHRIPNSLTFSPLTPKSIPPLRYTSTSFKKLFLLKPHATFLPIQQSFNFISPSIPTKETISSALAILFAFSKTVVEKAAVSIHEFKEPLVAVANAVGKWVDIYHSVLIVRILLSWFPNMPWEKQPFSAIRDLCDPCLNFFRTIMPPSANKKIDLSPLLAFVFFGVLSSFLKTPVQAP